MNLDNLPLNWFDVAIVVVLSLGVQQGRKHGVSVELLRCLKWLAILFGSAFAYEPVAELITSTTPALSMFWANLLAYSAAALLIASLFAFLKKASGGKLFSGDAFGNGEFYLGMAAGVVTFACITFTLLALLNSRLYSPAEVRAQLKYQNEVYGSDFFPSLYTVQSQVFEKSFAGPWIKKQLSWLLIKPTVPEQTQLARKEFSVP